MRSALASLQSKIKLSPGEQRLVALLPSSGKHITTRELAKMYYAKREAPFNSRLVIVAMVRNLQRKIETIHASPLYVNSSERAGPYPMQVWRSNKRD